jgi:hypothetical protein
MLSRVKVRKSLNGDALFGAIRDSFAKIPDHRPANSQILLRDALMSAFAMFSLKDPSLWDYYVFLRSRFALTRVAYEANTVSNVAL